MRVKFLYFGLEGKSILLILSFSRMFCKSAVIDLKSCIHNGAFSLKINRNKKSSNILLGETNISISKVIVR